MPRPPYNPRALCASLFALALAGCAQSAPRPTAPAPPSAPTADTRGTASTDSVIASVSAPTKPSAAAKPDAPSKQPPIKTNIAATGKRIHMQFTDPKTGAVQWKASAKSITAVSANTAADITGVLHGVDGTLYQGGAPADRLMAPTVTIDNQRQTVIASGGVTVSSLTQADTSVRCDAVTFYAAKSILIGSGHVRFTKGGYSQTGDSFEADTKLKELNMPAPSLSGHSPSVSATFHM